MIEHRVIGPPGTGKTSYLTRQCQVAASKYMGTGVAVASLTRTAAKEVASRATGIPPENIGTLHAHAYRRLNRPPICEKTDGIREWNTFCKQGSWRLTERASANPEAAPLEGAVFDTVGDELLSEMGVLRQRMVARELWPLRVRAFADRWEEFKASTGRIDFTDMIERAIEEIDSLDIDVLMLDEAQDMSRLEMTLARKWGSECQQIVVVGDPDQNLYQWRGSDPQAFFAAEAATQRVLAQSYRVPRAVHQLASTWIEQIPGRQPAEYKPRDHEGQVVHHRQLHYRDVDALVRLVEELQTRGGTTMVLGSCGYMLNPLCAGLRAAAVPFGNPYRPDHGGWNPLVGARRLLAFLRPQRGVWGDEARLWSWEDVRAFTDPLTARDVLHRGMKELIKAKAGYASRFRDELDGQITRLQDVLDVFEEQHWGAIYDQDIDWWESNLKHTERKRQAFSCNVARKHGGAALLADPKVMVGTIHSVKGGEADHVVLLPDLSATAYEQWMSRGEGHDAIVRQFYVGMTRAREELHVIGGSGPMAVSIA